MKTTRFLVLCSGAFAVLTACSVVNVQQPAGDKVAKLDPEKWEGTWRGADDARLVSKVVDAAKGLLEIRSSSPGEEKVDTMHLVVRELKDRLVATAVPKPGEEMPAEGGGFFRIVLADDHAVLFMPQEAVFKEAVTKGTIAGKVRKAKKENERDLTTLDRFGAAELDKLPLNKKGSILECFEPDPAIAVVREKKAAAAAK